MNEINPTVMLDDTVRLAGLIVRSKPQYQAAVKVALSRLPGVEIHAQNAEGALVVTAEQTPQTPLLREILEQIALLPHVVDTSLVYAHHDGQA